MLRALPLRCVLTAHAHDLLVDLLRTSQTLPDEPLVVQVSESDLTVSIKVAPSDSVEGRSAVQFPGMWLSASEQLIWGALGDGPLIGKKIAGRLNWEYTTRLRYLLSNLEERGVLVHDETTGYARATLQDT